MIRKIDELGRIGIPKAAREALRLSAGTHLSITWDEQKEQIILKKQTVTCIVCGNHSDLVEKSGIVLCNKCLQNICKKT